MRSVASAAPPGALVEDVPSTSLGQGLLAYVQTVYALSAVECHRIRREPSVLLLRAAQPLLWLLVFGAAVSRIRGLGPSGVDYQAYIVPGVLAQSVLFVAVFSGLSVIWERDLGISQRIVVAPVAPSAIVLGKAVGAGLRALVIALVVLVVAGVVGIPLRWNAPAVLGAMLATVLGAMLFAGISMVIASAVRSREHFMGVGQLITLPLFFASTALYPLSLMPEWLRLAAQANPLTYEVELLRHLLLGIGPDRPGLDLLVLLLATAAPIAIAARTYPRRVM